MGTQYTLKFENKSTLSGSVCVYQSNPGQNLHSLVWLSKFCHPSTRVTFRWSTDYSFVWSETGMLTPGITFDASEVKDTDPGNENINSTGFTKDSGAYRFTDTPKQIALGLLGIYTDDTMPNRGVSIGIGMSGQPLFACAALANFEFIFKPKPEYWIAFGEFEEGEVIDVNRVSNARKIVFPANVYSQTAILRENDTWEVATPNEANSAVEDNLTKKLSY